MTPTKAYLFERIRAVYPDADLSQADVNEDGLVNVAVIAGGRVYRFARTTADQPVLMLETAVINLVRRYVDVPVPAFENIADDFVTYPFLPGEALMRHDLLTLPDATQDSIARQIAGFITQLHSVPVADAQAIGLEAPDPADNRARWLRLYNIVKEVLFPLMYRVTQDYVNTHFTPVLDDPHWLDYEPVLIHNDLAQYHILYDAPSASITGVLDFGVANLNDPAKDYGILINEYGETFLRRLAAHDPRLPQLIDRARFYAGCASLEWAAIGVRSGDPTWFTAHLDRARDTLPYGVKL